MPHATVFDLEFTAWENSMAQRWLAPGEFTEVVQIGAVKLDVESFALLDEFEILVKPRINPLLSDFLVRLTGITNEALAARGVDFAVAYREFVSFADGGPIIAFGRDDRVLLRNLRLYAIAQAPPIPPYRDVIPWLAEYGIAAHGFHACDVARLCGASFSGREHDALEDSRAVALGIKTLVGRGARNILIAP